MWNADDIKGYTQLLDAFVDGELGAEPFSEACVALWTADRDQWARSLDTDRLERAEQLLCEASAHRITAEQFGHQWAVLWACGYKRPRPCVIVLGLLHHWAYCFTPDEELQQSDPRNCIDEWRLWDVMMALRAVLRCLTEEDWSSI